MIELAIFIYILFGAGFAFSTAVDDKGNGRFLVSLMVITAIWPFMIGASIGAGMVRK